MICLIFQSPIDKPLSVIQLHRRYKYIINIMSLSTHNVNIKINTDSGKREMRKGRRIML